MAVASYRYGTMTIELFLYFSVVFSFPPSTEKLLGDCHVNRRCTEQVHRSILSYANTNSAPMTPARRH